MSDTPGTAEEAARKAREIAAKLLGKPISDQSKGAVGTPTSKKRRWGVAPSAAPGIVLPGMDMMTKKLKQEKEPVQKRLWITAVSRERPAWHYVTYMGPKHEEIIRKVTAENPNEGGKLTICFRGRGSSRQPALPGIPSEPLHVFVDGPPLLAEAAEGELELLLQQAEKAEVTVDIAYEEELVKSAAGSTGNPHQQLALLNSAHSAYTPATVAQLIGNMSKSSAAAVSIGDWPSEEIHVPNGVVGFIIGRGGETISSLQGRTGAKVQIQKEHELQPGQTLRTITVSAPTQEAVDQCKTMITSMVEDRVRAAGGSVGVQRGSIIVPKEAKVQQALDQGHVLKTVEVPDADVGLIIGKGGSTIQNIQDRTGASIQIPPAANMDNSQVRTVSITHPNENGAQEAASMIASILASKQQQNENGGAMVGQQVTVQVMIPDKDVGLCIGRQGCVIKEMQNKSRTRIQIPGQPTPGQPHRIATVSGTPEACEQVRGMIERIILEQSSGCVMAGTGGGGYHHGQGGCHQGGCQQQQPQQGGQHDYSAEWAAYYAAQQVVQEQQTPAPAPTASPSTPGAPSPAPDSYYEEFFRYSYYYGETAARQYYGAWSPPPGTTNPYGVNPDGATQSPVHAAAAPAPAPTPVLIPAMSVQQGRETSMRKVSNLPAWMTRQQQG